MHYHLIGIGGVSMRGVAQYLRHEGHQVSGCDLQGLALSGVAVNCGHNPQHLDGVDTVVISSAVTPQSAAWDEYCAARDRGIPVFKRAEVIGQITQKRTTLTVSGMHGKSTTTGMLAHVLDLAQTDPLVMIGAPLLQYKGAMFRWGEGPLVLEADEFDRSFHQFLPTIAILTNIEEEHLDYYRGGLTEILESFRTFVLQIRPGGMLIACGDDPHIQQLLDELSETIPFKVLTYGVSAGVDVQVAQSELAPGVNRFCLLEHGQRSVELSLQVPGFHNQLNATAVFLALRAYGLAEETIVSGLKSFSGIGQRFDFLGSFDATSYYLDYAHHPTEILATIRAARAWLGDRPIRVVFQPHQYARTQAHFSDFAQALSEADAAIVTDIFGVAGREDSQTVSAQDLADAVPSGEYRAIDALRAGWRSIARPGEAVILMGAGRDILRLAEEVRNELQTDE